MALEPITRKEKIIAGENLEPITRMEQFLKKFGGSGGSGGGSSVQSDWNQNDSTAADYVKNRPFYTGDPMETVLVEETTVPFTDDNGLYFASFPSTFEAIVGETYKVSWDGTVYECTCMAFHEASALGNLSILGAGSDTGEPFVIVISPNQGTEIDTADTSASHTFSISNTVAPVVKIDEKYLPTIPDDKLPAIPADKLPAIPADKLPAIPVIEFTTRISDSIANAAQPSFYVSNLRYSEIYALVEKGNFQIKDAGGYHYIPTNFGINSDGSIFISILVTGNQIVAYATLYCSANQTRFYRNTWWQIEATKK